MKCPHCGAKTIVKESREIEGDTYRERRCPKCRKRTYTFEAVDESGAVKRSLLKYHSDYHRNRSQSSDLQKHPGRNPKP